MQVLMIMIGSKPRDGGRGSRGAAMAVRYLLVELAGAGVRLAGDGVRLAGAEARLAGAGVRFAGGRDEVGCEVRCGRDEEVIAGPPRLRGAYCAPPPAAPPW